MTRITVDPSPGDSLRRVGDVAQLVANTTGITVGMKFNGLGQLFHPNRSPRSGPVIVCLCGSTRFRTEMTEANRAYTMAGCIVLAPGVFQHDGDPLTEEAKVKLDELHLRKIDMADHVIVINPGGYIGESTAREIDYALAQGKNIGYWNLVPEEKK